MRSEQSREAAIECSPRRKPWVASRIFCASPVGAEEIYEDAYPAAK